MPTFFEFFDGDGDHVSFDEGGDRSRGEVVGVCVNDRAAFLSAAAVDRLRAALAPYGTVEAATEIVVGREYRLLPGARHNYGPSDAAADGVTRVRVNRPADSDGDYGVTALDGRRSGRDLYCVAPKYLAPMTPEPAATGIVDPAHFETVAPLDPRRVAAWHKARELAGSHADTYDVLRLTEFLYGEAV